MPSPIRIVVGLVPAIVAGLSVFMLILIATGVGPGRPWLPRRTTATVLTIKRENVSVQAPRHRYFATVRWTNEHGAVLQEQDAWGRIRAELTEGATVPAVIFHATGDSKTRLSGGQIGLGSVGDYWRNQGLWDWGIFWGPILVVFPSALAAYVLLGGRIAFQARQAA